jgi:hypothetical protein
MARSGEERKQQERRGEPFLGLRASESERERERELSTFSPPLDLRGGLEVPQK